MTHRCWFRFTIRSTRQDLRPLLRPPRRWPCDRRAAEQRDELASLHSITSSASASSLSGTVSPSAFAVLRWMTSSNLVGCMTGRSAGFSPLRIRPTLNGAFGPLPPHGIARRRCCDQIVARSRRLASGESALDHSCESRIVAPINADKLGHRDRRTDTRRRLSCRSHSSPSQ
jgi:hypothetical protein